ncbi:MAG: TPM domain-containing protein [Clostridia bacterium]|nr:TPM domain-containing protein [Clostridia bacterium]
MRKIASVFLILLLFMPIISTNSSASISRIIDEDGFLGGDLAELEAKLYEAEAECGIPIRIYLYDEGKVAFGYSENHLLRSFGFDTDDDVILLLITREYNTYYYELFTYGDGYDLISDAAADRILDDSGVYSIKRADFGQGISAFASVTSYEVLEGRRSARLTAIIVPIILGIIAGGIAFGVVFYRYKRKLKSPIYPLSNYARLNLTVARDDFITSHVTRVRINTSQGGSGGRGGGGSRGRR